MQPTSEGEANIRGYFRCSDVCCLCGKFSETIDHIFVYIVNYNMVRSTNSCSLWYFEVSSGFFGGLIETWKSPFFGCVTDLQKLVPFRHFVVNLERGMTGISGGT